MGKSYHRTPAPGFPGVASGGRGGYDSYVASFRRFLLPVCLLGLAACGAAPPPPPPPAPDPAAAKAQVVDILEALERSFYSHWGSVESTELYARLSDAQIPLLREIAESNGDHALMALRILAKRSPSERFSPGLRAILYWTTFQRDLVFNRWGVISKSGFVPGIYGSELLALGVEAAPYLQKSLQDTRRAPVFGGEDERTNRIQADRVCDYAWIFLATLFDRPINYQVDPRFRDPQIHELDLWMDRRKR